MQHKLFSLVNTSAISSMITPITSCNRNARQKKGSLVMETGRYLPGLIPYKQTVAGQKETSRKFSKERERET